MSQVFPTGSDFIDLGSPAGLDNQLVLAWGAWITPSAFVNGGRIALKNVTNGIRTLNLNGTTGSIQIAIQAPTGGTAVKSTPNGALQLGQLHFVMGMINFGVSGDFYVGTDKQIAVSVAPTGANGTGTPADDSAANAYVGANGLAGTQPFPGPIHWIGMWRDRLPNPHEVALIQRMSRNNQNVLPPVPGCVLYGYPGKNGRNFRDMSPSGHHGTASGNPVWAPNRMFYPPAPSPRVATRFASVRAYGFPRGMFHGLSRGVGFKGVAA